MEASRWMDGNEQISPANVLPGATSSVGLMFGPGMDSFTKKNRMLLSAESAQWLILLSTVYSDWR